MNASRKLLLQEWLAHHHVHENFNAARFHVSASGSGVSHSYPFSRLGLWL